jgi:protoporphyrin/coproporphyrin ferrochelatase
MALSAGPPAPPTEASPTGVLLLQLGTPDSPAVGDVRRYLREFLSDPRVLDMPAPARRLLLEAVILPFRPRRTAHAYRQIWTAEGSPLLLHGEALARDLRRELGPGFHVVLGMRYGEPSIPGAVADLHAAGCARIVMVPLFPQYSSAATGSAVEKALGEIAGLTNVPAVSVVGSFYDHPGFIDAAAEVARQRLDDFAPDHVLFSYHGLPEKHIRASDPTGARCLANGACCDRVTAENRFCYRAHCYATSKALADRLGLAEGSHTTSFQSRLAGQKWIEPYTDRVVVDLRDRGVGRLAVLTPSFAADCLETLEEIGIRLRRQWQELGGEAMLLVPCVNAAPRWVAAVADMVRGTAAAPITSEGR